MVDDSGVGAEARGESLADLIHNAVVWQGHMDAFGTVYGISRRGGHPRARRLERARLRFGAVPHRHRVAALQHPFDHCAPQQSGSDKRHVRHREPPATIYRECVDFTPLTLLRLFVWRP